MLNKCNICFVPYFSIPYVYALNKKMNLFKKKLSIISYNGILLFNYNG